MMSNTISSNMPILEHIKRIFQAEFGDNFSKLPNRGNTLFVIIQHGFATIRPMMEALQDLGIASDQIFMTTKPHTTPLEDMLPYFKNTFEHYVPFQWSASQSVLDQPDIVEAAKSSHYKMLTAVTHKKLFEHFCDYLLRYQEGSNRKIENIIICDEGGKFLSQFIKSYNEPDPHALRNLKNYRVVAIEHTKSGTYSKALVRLQFPLIVMADSYLKTKIESKFIAKSMFVNLKPILTRIINSPSVNIGVVGCGNIGREVIKFLRHDYPKASVILYDGKSSILSLAKITELGWHNVVRADTIQALFQQASIILGCTGTDVTSELSQEEIVVNSASHIHLISCSSGDVEFQTLLQRMPNYQFKSLADIRDWIISFGSSGEKKLTIYNGGFPINFLVHQPESVPESEIQITRSMKLAAIVQALKLLEVMSCFSKKECDSLNGYIKLDVVYQWEIIKAYYNELTQGTSHTLAKVAEKSKGTHQPRMSLWLKVLYHIRTNNSIKILTSISSFLLLFMLLAWITRNLFEKTTVKNIAHSNHAELEDYIYNETLLIGETENKLGRYFREAHSYEKAIGYFKEPYLNESKSNIKLRAKKIINLSLKASRSHLVLNQFNNAIQHSSYAVKSLSPVILTLKESNDTSLNSIENIWLPFLQAEILFASSNERKDQHANDAAVSSYQRIIAV